ncbi:membrane protein insertase YidC [Erysipelotrichaceae bacterium Oil+RF-744-GAM-WT-6]|jgi:YidC/Oxa1 family membrane protein insertase|uniref:Membrane protein insertase YidC n=1 Tax=Stecheria intestinalis TaxID=2606630 RepID=A0A7X2NUD3_9FIRM|nr:YidC/Oxa1 family membrane protein insertase [Stecheria intestinalis]MCI6746945.1 YidC/Oxa1 family membrane protein insertase [Anaerolactibacter massiliensis]MDY3233124.1 YidC/Oxa1 family membrane protein insertase [Erysipelotrichaceae bacterium]MDD5881757.1 YidC/Oxa1 family membrane protein insertase [Stecheria intestinalis]MDD6365703.1 YidC/Oxa1 family membrane protein insertase [Stecheria intestinalis]MSS59653.1 membrane protein insertase YidC [Stecheria intestinalis]
MKFNSSRMKKVLLLSAVVLFAVSAAGCSVPTDETGAVKQITSSTTFNETMNSENWFSAILVWPMAQVLNRLAPSIGVAGAIAVLTIAVNAILLVFTLKSTIATQEMQMLQPEIEKITRKYEGKTDQASQMRMAQEQQALYKKYNINPFSMILVTFLQFPIIIAMYQAVQRATAVKTGTFMGLSLETKVLDGIRGGMWGYLLIFAIMGLAQYVSMMLPQKLSKKRAEAEAAKHHRRPDAPANSSQQKMMQIYMLVMILVFGLMWPAAMSVYWTIYSLVTIVKTLIVQKIVDDRQAKEAQA